jgi:ubiquinol-cytochrome c reductase cytochrome c subunit
LGLRRAPERRVLSRSARALIGWAAVAMGATAVVLLSGGGGEARAQEAEVALGAELYAANCAACHGPRGEGGPGETGLTAGPAVAGIDVNYVDQQMRTGRMPIVDRAAGVVRELELSDDEREAVLAWMEQELELEGERIRVGEGDASRGQELYLFHCAACHGSVGNGGIVGRGVTALSLRGIDPVAIVQATRVGPYQMPAFSEDLISEQDANDLAAFTSAEIEDPQRSLLGLTEQNRVGLAGMASLLLLLVVGGAMLVARPAPAPSADGERGPE